MADRPKKHRDVEFSVDDAGGKERIFNTFDEAAGFAIAIAASKGETVNIDVLIHSRAGAEWWGGDHAAEEYESDPDASVSERIEIRAESVGRVY